MRAVLRKFGAVSMFVAVGMLGGLFLGVKLPESNWNFLTGGAMGFALAVLLMVDGYIQRSYLGFEKFQMIAVAWFVFGLLAGLPTFMRKDGSFPDSWFMDFGIAVGLSLSARVYMAVRPKL